MTLDRKQLTGIALISGAILLVYWPVFRSLLTAWLEDGNYSHGFLIPPLAAYFAWERRDRLQKLPIQPSWFGIVLMVGGILILLVGLLGSELFLTRISLLFLLAGIVQFLFGTAHLRALMFPLAFLVLMIPLPAIIFNKIALPLQFFASRVGESTISAANIPVLREGNVLVLANTKLEVAEACSGIRSLVSLITLGIVFAYFADTRTWVRVAIVLSTIPVAIIANGARVAGTGILAHWYGDAAAQGFFHEFSCWVVFVVAFVMILALQRLILRFVPKRPTPGPAPA